MKNISGKQNMLKVLIVAPEFPIINQPWMDTYVEQLIKSDINFTIFSNNTSPKDYHKKVDRLELLKKTVSHGMDRTSMLESIFKKPRFISAFKALLSLKRDMPGYPLSLFKYYMTILHFMSIENSFFDGDIIHSHSEVLSFRFLIFSFFYKVPLVVTFHGLPPHGVRQLTSRERSFLYSKTAKVIVNTYFACKQVQALGCGPDKIVVLPQGLPLEDFPFSPPPIPVGDEVIKVLSVGRYHRDKGHHYSLIALKRLVSSGLNIQWTFVGSGTGHELSRLRSISKKLGLNDHVLFLGSANSEKLLALYHSHHIFVLASKVETQGVVIQEAQATGCIVIASNVGGIPECVNDGEDALLVKQQSSKAIVSAVTYLLDNKKSWTTLRESARNNVEKNFSASVIGKKMADLLNNVRSA